MLLISNWTSKLSQISSLRNELRYDRQKAHYFKGWSMMGENLEHLRCFFINTISKHILCASTLSKNVLSIRFDDYHWPRGRVIKSLLKWDILSFHTMLQIIMVSMTKSIPSITRFQLRQNNCLVNFKLMLHKISFKRNLLYTVDWNI